VKKKQYGWICTRCQRSWAAKVRECSFCKKNFALQLKDFTDQEEIMILQDDEFFKNRVHSC
jgi:hypothetical protein